VPSEVARTPEERKDRRSVHVNRFDDVIRTINIRIAYHLDIMSFVISLFYHNGSHILIHVISDNGLQHYQVGVTFCAFYYAKVIYLTVSIQIEIVDPCIIIVNPLFEFFQISRVCKNIGYSSQVEIIADVGTFGLYRNIAVGVAARTVVIIVIVVSV